MLSFLLRLASTVKKRQPVRFSESIRNMSIPRKTLPSFWRWYFNSIPNRPILTAGNHLYGYCEINSKSSDDEFSFATKMASFWSVAKPRGSGISFWKSAYVTAILSSECRSASFLIKSSKSLSVSEDPRQEKPVKTEKSVTGFIVNVPFMTLFLSFAILIDTRHAFCYFADIDGQPFIGRLII